MTIPLCPVREISAALQRLHEEGSPIIGFIRNHSGLTRALRDLEALASNVDIKCAIANQLKDYFVTCSQGRHYTGKMHAVFSGDPGVGKSTVAKIVARIWHCLGLPRGAPTLPPAILPTLCPEASVDIADFAADLGRLTLQLQAVSSDEPIWHDIASTCGRMNKSCHEMIDMCRPLSEAASDCNPITSIPALPLPDISYEEEDESCYVLAGREDFVGPYQGHSSLKTTAFLEANRGKVIIIEEAYNLFLGSGDHFGPEALVLINRAMDECEDDYIFIFNGYSAKLQHTIFAVQPGLTRRIQWRFDLSSPGVRGLTQIFQQQMRKCGHDVLLVEAEPFFYRNKEYFPAFGGDTERLANHCRIAIADDEFNNLITHTPFAAPIVVGRDLLDRAFEEYQKCVKKDCTYAPHMYGLN